MAIIDEKVRMEMLEHCYHGPAGRPDRVVTYKQEDLPAQAGILDVECGRFSEKQDFVWQTDDRLEARRTWCYVENPQYKNATVLLMIKILVFYQDFNHEQHREFFIYTFLSAP